MTGTTGSSSNSGSALSATAMLYAVSAARSAHADTDTCHGRASRRRPASLQQGPQEAMQTAVGCGLCRPGSLPETPRNDRYAFSPSCFQMISHKPPKLGTPYSQNDVIQTLSPFQGVDGGNHPTSSGKCGPEDVAVSKQEDPLGLRAAAGPHLPALKKTKQRH